MQICSKKVGASAKRSAAIAATGVLSFSMISAFAAPAAAQTDGEDALSNPAAAAGQWLLSQASAEDGQAWEVDGAASQSASLDAVIGLMAAGYGSEQTEATLGWLDSADVLGAYLEGEEGDLQAGAAGKTLLAVAAAGGDITDFGGYDLVGDLSEAQDDDGSFGDGATLSNAWALLGLHHASTIAGADVAADIDAAVDALVAQQCDDGSFAFEGITDDGCFGDPDTTGIAAAALATTDGDHDDALDALNASGAWLLGLQGDDGGVDGGFGANANSTAMAGQALLAIVTVPGADDVEALTDGVASAGDYLQSLQVDCSDEANVGAIRFQADESEAWMEGARDKATADSLLLLGGSTLVNVDAAGAEATAPNFSCGNDANVDSAVESDDENGNNWLLWAIFAAGAVLVLIAIGVILKSRKNAAASSEGDK
ncbi:hypothetical protein [Natronoglycomyces albus]|uniref:Terpene cyclase/mutase family protein n=1 Tax=Natronoglycomyces albus TaxID=2811108 RepID=A0A895XP04_9ACTN|nr:hypothetical protein [Natronoglycomyces albus]QSB05492.1 hypothetical protein JQS30_00675 [Natronoglycomyces albus]